MFYRSIAQTFSRVVYTFHTTLFLHDSEQSFVKLTKPIVMQTLQSSHLKVSLLQESFVREVWKCLGKQIYLEKLHPLIIYNLCNSPKKTFASVSSASSVLLICSSEELGIPITLHQVSSLMNFAMIDNKRY